MIDRKILKFLKNVSIGVVVAGAAGAGAGELSDLLTSSHVWNAVSSTAAQYATFFATFLPLHAYDNKDLYRDSTNRFRWRPFLRDAGISSGILAGLDVLYLLGRPFVQTYFQRKGYNPAASSVMADMVCVPAYVALSIPLLRRAGIFRLQSKPSAPGNTPSAPLSGLSGTQNPSATAL